MDNYLLYILAWAGILILIYLLFKFLPAKMKQTEDRQTKNSLFSLLLILGVPLIFAAVIGPIILVAGDENMPVHYKYGYGIISVIVIAYLVYLQVTKPKKG
jgi:purine-cytosine permease-like protein